MLKLAGGFIRPVFYYCARASARGVAPSFSYLHRIPQRPCHRARFRLDPSENLHSRWICRRAGGQPARIECGASGQLWSMAAAGATAPAGPMVSVLRDRSPGWRSVFYRGCYLPAVRVFEPILAGISAAEGKKKVKTFRTQML